MNICVCVCVFVCIDSNYSRDGVGPKIHTSRDGTCTKSGVKPEKQANTICQEGKTAWNVFAVVTYIVYRYLGRYVRAQEKTQTRT